MSDEKKKNNFFTEYLMIFLRGSAMGAADIIPGVSGGTIAFLTGIYPRLINAITSVDLTAVKLFFTGKFKDFWKHIDGTFLLSLVGGIVLSLLSLARLMDHLLKMYPILVWSFFFGLILASTAVVLRKITKWSWSVPVLFILTAAGAFFLTGLTPAETPNALWFIFIAGAIAICAMILPGISGSFLLVLLGKYVFMIGALKEMRIPVILVFIAGCLIGILGFSRALKFFLSKFWNQSIGALAGFMLGSLNKVWPWKITLKTMIDRHGDLQPMIQKNVWPWVFSRPAAQGGCGMPSLTATALICFLAGAAVVTALELLARKKKTSE